MRDMSHEIYNNVDALEVYCCRIIKGAKAYFTANPPKNPDKTVRSRVEFWLEEHLIESLRETLVEEFDNYDDEN